MSSLRMGKGVAFKVFREALAGYTFDIDGIIAGTIIVLQLEVFWRAGSLINKTL